MSRPEPRYPDCVVILFTRVPVAGAVKTRLVAALGPDGACQLHRRLLGHCLAMLRAQSLAAVEIWKDSPRGDAQLDGLPWPVHVQTDGDLGQRMAHAVGQALGRYRQVLLIGTDCPALGPVQLEAAITQLDRGTDLVLGPATDGGYVLVGLKAQHSAIFSDIDWGTARVLAQTLAAGRASGLTAHCLEPLADIDRPEDLKHLALLNKRI